MLKRIIIDILLLVVVLIAPWWISLLAIMAAIFYFSEPPFWEALIFGFILDLFYGAAFLHLPFSVIFTMSAFALLILISIFKKRLKFY